MDNLKFNARKVGQYLLSSYQNFAAEPNKTAKVFELAAKCLKDCSACVLKNRQWTVAVLAGGVLSVAAVILGVKLKNRNATIQKKDVEIQAKNTEHAALISEAEGKTELLQSELTLLQGMFEKEQQFSLGASGLLVDQAATLNGYQGEISRRDMGLEEAQKTISTLEGQIAQLQIKVDAYKTAEAARKDKEIALKFEGIAMPLIQFIQQNKYQIKPNQTNINSPPLIALFRDLIKEINLLEG